MQSKETFPSILLRALLCVAQIVFMFPPARAFAEFGLPSQSPYTFGPEGRTIQDLVDFAPPIQVISFPAHQPIQATDQYGNKLFYNTSGKLIMSVGVDGSMTTYTSGGTRSFDADGKFIEETKSIKGTNRSETRNDQGEITGYATKAFGDKVAQEFDADGNLLRTYAYTDYAKSTAWVRDELSQTRTVFNSMGLAEKDIDFEGNVVATYGYDDRKKIISKTDIYDNVTSFDKFGRQAYTANSKGEKVVEYQYKSDENGNNVLEKVIDLTPGVFGGDVTTFHNNMQVETRSKFGGVAQKFHYRGHTLVYSYDTRTNEVTWYNKNGRQSMTTMDGEVVREQLYFKARFVGYIDHRANRIVLYQYERQDEEVKFFKANDMPTAAEIEKYYELLCKMKDVIPTDINSVKQSGGLVHNNTIPLDRPQAASQRVMALNLSKSNETFSDTAKNSIVKAKYNYAGGKLQSVVSQNLDDGSGITTSIFIGPGSANLRTSITATKDQSANTAGFEKLWDAVVNKGKSIADISAASDELSALAAAIKNINITSDKIAGLTDDQLCGLFGWDIAAVNTKRCLEDVRARANNAGAHGIISVLYGFGDGQAAGRLYAAVISGTNDEAFTVGGLYANKVLDLTTAGAYKSVTSRSADETYVNSLDPAETAVDKGTDNGIGEGSLEEKTLPAGVFTKTVNGVSRAYAANGNVLYELDSQAGRKTLYDVYGRKKEVYNAANHIVEAYSYGKDGRIEAMASWGKDNTDCLTTFFVGFGVAGEDQATVTVGGNQLGKHQLVQQMLDAANVGISLTDTALQVREFVNTINTIEISAHILAKMNSAQLCSLFGWDADAPDTEKVLKEVSAMVEDAGFDGTLSLKYGSRAPSVAIISAKKAGSTPPSTLDITLSGYTVVNPASPIEAATANLTRDTGISLLESFSNAIGRITHTLKQ